MLSPRVWAEVRLDRFKRNVERVRRAVGPGVEVMAVVKADAYGHGAVPIARAALEAGATRLAVGDSSEALALREAAIAAPIAVLGALVEREIDEVVHHGITPTVHSLDRVKLLDLKARRHGRRLPVHLMVDTGMGRLGVRPSSAEALLVEIASRPNLVLEGVATHFAAAADDPAFTTEQLARFTALLARARARGLTIPIAHAANSAALAARPEARLDLVRPGAALYGLDPSGAAARAGLGLEPVLALRSQVVFLKRVEKGTPIGYGTGCRTGHATRVATVAIGYHDGYPHPLSGKAWVLIRGRRAPLLGTVTMDYIMADVGHIPGVRVGDAVTLVGRDGAEEIRCEELAKLAGTIAYDIPAGLGRRVRRVYVTEDGDERTMRHRERTREPRDQRESALAAPPARSP